MKMSLSWLRRYVDINVPVDELCNKMIMSGFEVEDIEDLSASMSNVVVGRIVKLEKHPDADKLQICQIDIGTDETVQIVTGASNVFEGAYVPAALHDSHLPNGMHIKKGKLRGVPSNGMLCSGEELCLTESDYPGAGVYGIMILQGEQVPGTDMRDVLNLRDIWIDFKITANRPDCQSVLGVAREIAVALKSDFHPPVPQFSVKGENITDYIDVAVEEPTLCPRYMGRLVRNLRIGPSPDWVVQCLKSAGVRSINNIVDITNFVMLETGHPMHAFDLRDIAGNKLTVRRARSGETITTLDEKPHTLTEDMLVIADQNGPSCLAGIMGGQNSGIKEDTQAVFFECAKFERACVRRTARALGMRSESSARFERGVDAGSVQYAMDRALQLIEEWNVGDIVDGTIDRYQQLPQARTLTASAQRIRNLLGVDIPTDTMVDILCRLQIPTTAQQDTLTCTVPTFRDDIEGTADLAEEVMRIYGYEHIVATPLRGQTNRGTRLPQRRVADGIKNLLCGKGLYECKTYSFIGAHAIDVLDLPAEDERRREVVLLNPLGEEYSRMRTQLFTSMLGVMTTNINRKVAAARLFELDKVFVPKQLPLQEQPAEVPALCIGIYGEQEDFFTLKGLVESIAAYCGLRGSYERASEPFLHPGRSAVLKAGEQTVAVFGQVHPDTAEKLGCDAAMYVAQIMLDPLYAAAGERRVIYKPLPRFPAVERDLALLCAADLPVAEIESAIRNGGGNLLTQTALFDVYQGAQIAAGQKSVAYRLTFQSNEGTLTDEQLNPVLKKIFRKLEEKGCQLRG